MVNVNVIVTLEQNMIVSGVPGGSVGRACNLIPSLNPTLDIYYLNKLCKKKKCDSS